MKKILNFLMNNCITSTIVSIITYIFYGIVIGISMFPSIILIKTFLDNFKLDTILNLVLFSLVIGVSIYLFFIVALIVFGIVERILVIGFKPGKYPTTSPIFVRWLLYSGLHVILLNMVLPYVSGTVFAKIFYRILGCKIGKNVFINTVGLHDSYLLEIEDNVVIGGDANISCHIFEGRYLILNKIKIGANTLISAEAYLMPGVEVGKNCNIGLKAYVRKNRKIEDGSIIMAVPGVPSKKVAEIISDRKEMKKVAE